VTKSYTAEYFTDKVQNETKRNGSRFAPCGLLCIISICTCILSVHLFLFCLFLEPKNCWL